MRTLEELERLAYIEGRVEEAKILAQAHDGQIAIDECEPLEADLVNAEQRLEKARAALGEIKALCERGEG